MKMKKATTTILLAGMMCTIFLSACSTQKQEAGTKDKAPAQQKLNVFRQGDNLPAPENDLIKKEVETAIKATVNLNVIPSDYKNQLNIRMAAGDFPDLFEVDRDSLLSFSKKGLLLDLTQYQDKLKEVNNFIGDQEFKKGTVNGKLYGVTQPAGIPFATYWVRKDWLDKLHLEVPKTVDDLYEVAAAFTNQDPDGNGKKDTFGITGTSLDAFAPIFGAFGVGTPGSFYIKDGKLVNAYYDPKMKDALEFIKKLVNAQAIDPDLVVNKGTQHQEKAFQGKAGIIYIDWSYMTKDSFVSQYKKVNPNAEWIQIAAPKGVGGQFDGTWDTGAVRRYFAIPKALEKNPEKLQKVFDLLNYVSSPEGSTFVQYGIKGKHYNLENGKIVQTDLLDKEGGYFYLYQFTGRPEKEYLKTKFAKSTSVIDFAANEPRIQGLNGYIDTPDGYNSVEARRFADEEFINYIYGKHSLNEYDNFIKTLETTFNYKLLLDAAKSQLTQRGILK